MAAATYSVAGTNVQPMVQEKFEVESILDTQVRSLQKNRKSSDLINANINSFIPITELAKMKRVSTMQNEQIKNDPVAKVITVAQRVEATVDRIANGTHPASHVMFRKRSELMSQLVTLKKAIESVPKSSISKSQNKQIKQLFQKMMNYIR